MRVVSETKGCHVQLSAQQLCGVSGSPSRSSAPREEATQRGRFCLRHTLVPQEPIEPPPGPDPRCLAEYPERGRLDRI